MLIREVAVHDTNLDCFRIGHRLQNRSDGIESAFMVNPISFFGGYALSMHARTYVRPNWQTFSLNATSEHLGNTHNHDSRRIESEQPVVLLHSFIYQARREGTKDMCCKGAVLE